MRGADREYREGAGPDLFNAVPDALLSPVVFWHPERVVEPLSWVAHIPFAFWLVDALRPRTIVELGTQSGNSYLSFCQAVTRLSLDAKCFAVDTWKGDEQAGFYPEEVFHELSEYHDARYSAFSTLVRSTFDEAVGYFPDGTVDLLHVDGLHTYEAVRHDFENWQPKLSDSGVVLLHDTNVRERGFGVVRLWQELSGRYAHFEFVHGHGLGVLGVGRVQPDRVRELFALAENESSRAVVRAHFGRLGHSIAAEANLRKLDEEARSLRDAVRRLTSALTAEHEQAASLRGELDGLTRALDAEREASAVHAEELEKARQAIARRNAEIVRRDDELRAVHARLDEILASTSWRVTAPVRRVGLAHPLLFARIRSAARAPARLRSEALRWARGVWTSATPQVGGSPEGARPPATAAAAALRGMPAGAPRAARSAADQPIITLRKWPGMSGPDATTTLPPVPDGPRVICLSHVLPYPPGAGNEYRTHRLLSWLAHRGFDVVLIVSPLPGQAWSEAQLADVARAYPNVVLCQRDGLIRHRLADGGRAIGQMAGQRPRLFATALGESDEDGRAGSVLAIDRMFCHDVLIELLLRLERELTPAIVLANYVFMTRCFPLLDDRIFKIVDTIDVFSTKAQKVCQFGIPDSFALTVDEERARLGRADLVLAIQLEERDELERISRGKPVVTVGVDFDCAVEVDGAPDRTLLCVGSSNAMNVKGIRDFLRFAWPLVRRDVPDAELLVAGSVGDAVQGDHPGVKVLGRVKDLAEAYRRARVVINPAVAGTGVKVKTIEALCHLRRVVVWPSGIEGLPPEVRALCRVAHDWYAFYRNVVDLLAQPTHHDELARMQEAIGRAFAPATVYAELDDMLAALLGARSRAKDRTP